MLPFSDGNVSWVTSQDDLAAVPAAALPQVRSLEAIPGAVMQLVLVGEPGKGAGCD
ncbi:MAG TPA: hypothetical protein VIY52_17760 [Streptosporangiaceae bacterium]